MQLLIQRNQDATMFGRPIFKLWAKFELSGEEAALIDKYRVRDFLLAEGDLRRDLLRAAKWAALLAVVVFVFLSQTVGVGAGLRLSPLVFAGGLYGIYHHIRERITVSDILDGRFFACRSVVMLMAKEQTVTEMAVVFRRFLEAMKTWGGQEIMAIEPDKEPTLRLSEPSHALS